ncbi:DUF3422 family protein [Pseudomonas chlororaphis]
MAIKNMKLVLVYYTRFLFFCVNKFPRLFTRTFRNHFSPYLGNLFFQVPDTVSYQSAGILDGNGRWSSINVICPITPTELTSLIEWIQKKEFLHDKNDPETSTPHTEAPDFPIKYSTYIPFNDTYRFHVDRISVRPDAFRDCTITLIQLTNSVNYLSFDFSFTPESKKRLCKVDILDRVEYFQFRTINPLSKNFRISRSIDYIHEHLIEGIGVLVDDAHQIVEKLLTPLGIKTGARIKITTGQLKSGIDVHYIDSYDITNEQDHYALISSSGVGCSYYKDTTSDASYIYDLWSNKLKINAFLVDNIDDTYNLTDHLSSHLYLSLIREIEHKYAQCRDAVNPVLSTITHNTSESLGSLLQASIEIGRIEEKIEAITRLAEQYHYRAFRTEAENELQSLTEKVELLKKRIAQRKSLSNDQVQFENLKFNRFYSWIVGGLALLQVALAAITIDWSQALQSNNPVLNNLKALLRWLQG